MIDRYYVFNLDTPEDGSMPTKWQIASQKSIGFDEFENITVYPEVYETREEAVAVFIEEEQPVCSETLPCEREGE